MISAAMQIGYHAGCFPRQHSGYVISIQNLSTHSSGTHHIDIAFDCSNYSDVALLVILLEVAA